MLQIHESDLNEEETKEHSQIHFPTELRLSSN